MLPQGSRCERWTIVGCALLLALICSIQATDIQVVTTEYLPHVTLRENLAKGSVVATVTDTGKPDARVVTITVNPGFDTGFYAEKAAPNDPASTTWNIILNRTLDYETKIIDFPVQFLASAASETVYTTNFTIEFHVKDVNDNAPQFQNLPYNPVVQEDAQVGFQVFSHIHATDADSLAGNGVVEYFMEPVMQGDLSFQANLFIINETTGLVTLNGELDYEKWTFYQYKVTAHDLGESQLSSTTDLTIFVHDVQDTPPVFLYNKPTLYWAPVHEDEAVGSSLLTVTAIDGDRSIPNLITYNITNSVWLTTFCAGKFGVNPTSGELTVKSDLELKQPLVKQTCIMTIQATEQPGTHPQKGNYTTTTTAVITIRAVNNNPPVLTTADPGIMVDPCYKNNGDEDVLGGKPIEDPFLAYWAEKNLEQNEVEV